MSAYRPVQAPEVSCIGKDKLSHDVARKVASKLRIGAANSYHCEHCGFWHVGSHNQKKHKMKVRK